MSLLSSQIAALNDALRAQILIPQFGKAKVPGRILVTPGISGLAPEAQIEVLSDVRNFDAFTSDNDPHGEHDFGSFEHRSAGRIFWKIDYYNADLTGGSLDPANAAITCRVLTIMLAGEY